MGGGDVVEADVEERVEGDHVSRHVVGPFEDLWADVDEEGVGRPPSKDHDLGGRVVLQEEGHGGARPDGPVADLMRMESECRLASEHGTCGAQEVECELIL